MFCYLTIIYPFTCIVKLLLQEILSYKVIVFLKPLLIEIIFSLNGLGLLGFEAAINRDYPVLFGTLFFYTLVGLVMHLIGDLTYVLVDPRIDFETREV